MVLEYEINLQPSPSSKCEWRASVNGDAVQCLFTCDTEIHFNIVCFKKRPTEQPNCYLFHQMYGSMESFLVTLYKRRVFLLPCIIKGNLYPSNIFLLLIALPCVLLRPTRSCGMFINMLTKYFKIRVQMKSSMYH